MIAALICRLKGHDWREVGYFAGGSTYQCDRCQARGDSYWKCPSNWNKPEKIVERNGW